MQMSYVPKQSKDHADSDCKVAQFVGYKQIHSLIHSHTGTKLHILVQILIMISADINSVTENAASQPMLTMYCLL